MTFTWSLLLSFVAAFLSLSSAGGTDKPALILVPGAFHKASVYGEVTRKLRDYGYDHIDMVDLPSVGYEVADIERAADVDEVTELLEARLRTNEDVVLVGSSYGATVIMEAVEAFESYSSASTSTSATGGQILGLIMLSGYIPTIAEVAADPPRPDIRTVGASFFNYHVAHNGTPTHVTWDQDLANYPPQLTFYNLLNASAADYWTSQLRPSSFQALNATGTYIPYDGTFRTLYVVGECDNSVSPAFAQSYIDQEGAQFEVEVINGDHLPTLSRPDTVVDVIRRFAGEKMGSDGDEGIYSDLRSSARYI